MVKAKTVSKEMYLREAGFDSLPLNWDVVQVEDLISDDRGISVGVMYPGKHDPDDIPLIKAGDLVGDTISPPPEFRVSPEKHEEYRRTEFQGGEILMTLVGRVGQCAVVPPEMKGWNAARAVAVIRLADGEDADFVRHCFLSKQLNHLMNAWANTTVQPTLNLKEIRKLPLPWPPKPERDAIASILGALDDKIELNRRMNRALESLARAIFKSWFDDFDPVKINAGKINAGQMPASSAIPTTHDPKVLELFPSTFQDSGAPEGWEPTTLGDEVDFQTGCVFKSKSFTNEPPGTRLARGMNAKEGVFFWGNQTRYWPDVTGDIEHYLLRAGDVLIGMDGSKVGKNWVRVREVDLPCLLVQRVARLRAAQSVGENFLWILCGSKTFRRYVDSVKTGTSIPRISGGQIKSQSFVRPPRGDDRIFHKFEAIVSAFANQHDENASESAVMARMRDSLLPQLLSGELPVPAVLTATEEASA